MDQLCDLRIAFCAALETVDTCELERFLDACKSNVVALRERRFREPVHQSQLPPPVDDGVIYMGSSD